MHNAKVLAHTFWEQGWTLPLHRRVRQQKRPCHQHGWQYKPWALTLHHPDPICMMATYNDKSIPAIVDLFCLRCFF